MDFLTSLQQRWRNVDSLVCVGLDPDPAKFPAMFANDPDAIFNFCRDIVDATAEHVCAFKPQIAHFAAVGAENSLERLIAYIHGAHPTIPVILDAKRGDIGSTAWHYASEAFDRYRADAVTVNPYLGFDSLQPFLDRAGKGVVILCRTSNPAAADLQDLVVRAADGSARPLYQHIAQKVAGEWNDGGQCALVVGATWPEQLAAVRAIVGDMPLLVPGVGAQGGDVEAIVRNGKTGHGVGLVISSSRAVLYASNGPGYATAASAVARALRDEINRYR